MRVRVPPWALFYLLKVGTVDLSAGPTNVYLRISEGGDVASPVFGSDDRLGLGELVLGIPPADCRCESTMAEAAAELGLGVGEAPPKALKARAAIALFIAWGQRGIEQLGAGAAVAAMEAGKDFFATSPWQRWSPTQPISVRFSGSLAGTYEGCVFSGSGHGPGMALYRDRGAIGRLAAIDPRLRPVEAAKLPAIALLLEPAPDFVGSALVAAGYPPCLPVPLKSGVGEGALPTGLECLALAGAAKALSQIEGRALSAVCELTTDAGTVVTEVTVPPPTFRN